MSGADPSLQAVADRHRDVVRRALGDERRRRVGAVVARRFQRLVVVLEEIHDSRNQAAVLRTAEGLGLLHVHVIEGPDTPFVPHRKVCVDADRWLQVERHRSAARCLAALRTQGLAVYAGAPGDGAVPLWDLDCTRPCAFVFGNEHRGVSPAVRAAADRLFAIPMRGFAGSFNLSVAAGMALLHAVRQRELAGAPTDLSSAEADALAARYELRAVSQFRRLVGESAAGRGESGATRRVEPAR